jgi:hypothetical protein
MSTAFAKNNTYPTYMYHWNVGAASHVGELLPIWNNSTSAAGVFIQAYWASFIRSFDPNKFTAEFLIAKGHALDNPEWATFGTGNRMRFSDNNTITMEQVKQEEWNRCGVISSMGVHLAQ